MPPCSEPDAAVGTADHRNENQLDNDLNEATPPQPAHGDNDEREKPQEEQPQSETTTSSPSSQPSCSKRIMAFYWEHEFLILVLASILLALAYPKLGAHYVQPDITATWIMVVFIFLMAGLSLQTSAFRKAFLDNYLFNIYVQLFNFAVVSSLVFGVSRGLVQINVITQDLADGMVVCASLPMTISMVNVLTKAGNGDEAAAVFNAAIGNLLGVFISPVLILAYLGVDSSIDIVDIVVNLSLRVLLPVCVGQVLQCHTKVHAFMKQHKSISKATQQYALVFIVYTVFCKTFQNGSDSSIVDIVLMIVFQFILLTTVMILAWYSLRFLFGRQPKLRVMGLFGCTHKTVAIGVPLINAIYEDHPSVGLYTLPLLIWHPLQLILGTLLAPRLAAFVDREQERLGLEEDDDDDDIDKNALETATATTPSGSGGTEFANLEEGLTTDGDKNGERR